MAYNQLFLPLDVPNYNWEWPHGFHVVCVVGEGAGIISNSWAKKSKAVYINSGFDTCNIGKYYILLNANEKEEEFLFFVINFILNHNYYLLITSKVDWDNWHINSLDLISRLKTAYIMYV